MAQLDGPSQANPLVSHVAKALDWIGYQDGSVVSREILHQKTGSVTLFAFDAGQGLSEHTSPFDALVYLLEGEAEIRISGKSFCLKEGEIIIMPAHEPHALYSTRKFKMILTLLRS
jgi:quercetin dioxygenase-like cupin family protein